MPSTSPSRQSNYAVAPAELNDVAPIGGTLDVTRAFDTFRVSVILASGDGAAISRWCDRVNIRPPSRQSS